MTSALPHRARRLALAGLLVAALSAAASCGSSDEAPSPATTCSLTSECAGGLVCLLGHCTHRCNADRDCAAGSRCLSTSSADGPGCVAPDASACTGPTCPEGTVCARDGQCRTGCALTSDKACLDGQACVEATCVGTDMGHDSSAAAFGVATMGAGGAGGAAAAGGGGGSGKGGVGGVGGKGGSNGVGGGNGASGGNAGNSSGHGGSAGGGGNAGTAGSSAAGSGGAGNGGAGMGGSSGGMSGSGGGGMSGNGGGMSGNSGSGLGGNGGGGSGGSGGTQPITFQLLEPIAGEVDSDALGISGDGKVIVGSSAAASKPTRAVKWTGTSGLPTLLIDSSGGPGQSVAQAVDGTGAVIAGNLMDKQITQALFHWTQATGMVPVTESLMFQAPLAHGVSDDGKVIVGEASDKSGVHTAFRWSAAGGFQGIVPTGMESEAYGTSSDGALVVGTKQTSGAFDSFLWSNDTLSDAGDGPGFTTGAQAITRDGTIIIGHTTNMGGACFKRVVATMATTYFGVKTGYANAVSDSGEVIVGRTVMTGFHAAIFDSAGTHLVSDLLAQAGVSLGGVNLQEATGVSADGKVVVGTATDAMSHSRGWRVVLP